MPASGFHPAIASWFRGRFASPTLPQQRAWPEIRRGRHTLIAAPTGSGKTLAAFLAAIDDLVRHGLEAGGELPDQTRVVYVSPLKALSNDIRRNLEQPLEGIRGELQRLGLPEVQIRSLLRTGDTPSSERARMARRPPHILVTTPESLYILLASDGGRRMLRTARTLILDEIHAVAGNKRGSHLTLSVERLARLVRREGGALVRIGLSATQRPIEEVARFLVGHDEEGRRPACAIVDEGHRRELDLAVEVPRSPLEAVMPGEVWQEVYDRLAELVREHDTTLIFVNTRRMAERLTRHLAERLGDDLVRSHHGSLSRERRFEAEQQLKSGRLATLVATASLELGIDVGSVDLVCQIGPTRSIATLLQRVGRSGHTLEGRPKGRIFPTSRDELVESAALLDAVRRGELERLEIPRRPLDILAQQIVAEVAGEEWSEDDLFEIVTRAYPFQDLDRGDFDSVVRMLSEGFATARGRRAAYLHHDAVHGRLRARRGARLAAITSGGAIPDNADYRVVLEPGDTFIGTVNEDFAIESLPGDIFQLGNSSWRIRRIEQGRVLVEDARGQPPNIPFWFGEAPGRSRELSEAVSRLRQEIAARLEGGDGEAVAWLIDEPGLGRPAAEQLVEYLAASRNALGTMPTQTALVAERFFDEAGDQHLVLHAPFGSRLNRAWGLALRKRFCRTFNFELQAAATEDAIVLSLGPTHSFPAEDIFRYLRSASVREVLVQALLDAPMFGIRWRWNAGRALAILRWSGGRRVPPRLQRMLADDLVAVVFPDQLACLENIAGDREIPRHPLVQQTVRDCLEEAMDVDDLERLLGSVERGERELIVRELREPSPLAHEVLHAKPYAFLDDAPLEERRTQAVFTRRWLDPRHASELGRLDSQAIERVRAEAQPEATTADELHDALVVAGFLTPRELGASPGWEPLLAELSAARRATMLRPAVGGQLCVAAERLHELLVLHPAAALEPVIDAVRRQERQDEQDADPAAALVAVLRSRLEILGPTTASAMAADLAVEMPRVEAALIALEGEGVAMRGRFTPGGSRDEWCDRRLLARIHRYTLQRLRREIAPVSRADFVRFLLDWQQVCPGERVEGAESVPQLLRQLEGFSAPAAAWESELLPARMPEYDPAWLDAQCLSGRYVWGRPGAPTSTAPARSGPIRTTPIVIPPRERLALWAGQSSRRGEPTDRAGTPAAAVLRALQQGGALFFDEIVSRSGLLRTRVEEALGELVAAGRVTADSFTGLRSLLTPSDRRPSLTGRRKRSAAVFGMENAGRWSLLPSPADEGDEGDEGDEPDEEQIEHVARTLLRRWGVVFRAVLAREDLIPPWRVLLAAYRRLEDRGEVRGGRFVDGFSGEQFALPEAVGLLRKVRRRALDGELISVSAADPLNLTGIVLPGPRLAALVPNRLLFRDGQVIAVLESGSPRFLVELEGAARWEAETALLRRRVPPQLRAYLGRSA